MFKYPLAVTIDTNIFDAAKFDLCDTSPLKTLKNYVKNRKIKVVLSDIVVRESKRHIADQIKKICGIMRKARAAALEESTEHLIRTIGLGEILRIVTNKDELISKGEEMFDDFLALDCQIILRLLLFVVKGDDLFGDIAQFIIREIIFFVPVFHIPDIAGEITQFGYRLSET